jgi:pyruvate-ferredoxin/flavodoxin oxidoreductase
MSKKTVTIDGNNAAAHVAHATNEVIAIYPITPSSNMGEWADQWTAEGRRNIWGTVPSVTELQSEAGASGAVHGALTTGALTTTFTASQGLLLMIPNMFKIAGELTPTVFHIAARAVATQGLSIFGDHSDVMATRSTGYALLCSNSVQEVMDFALIAQSATLESRVPFLHFFDGFRTSHEVQKIEQLGEEEMRAMIDSELVRAHRARGLNPDRPAIRGTSQNPDTYFTGRETVNRYYLATPAIVEKVMERFGSLTGRAYRLFDYVGARDAERVVVMMGSGAETMEEVVAYLAAKGEKVGLIKVRLYRPWSLEHFAQALPASVKAIAVLDRTKEPGSLGEPLYEDVRTSIGEALERGLLKKMKAHPRIAGGRYGLASAEFNPGMAKAVLDNLKEKEPKNHFTVGINDDVTHTSLSYDEELTTEPEGTHRAIFYGLGADGTVGANKNSIKIIGKATDNFAQGYFVYDSKKSGARTVSHLRFGKSPIKSTYLIQKANFVACHKFTFTEKFDLLSVAEKGATFLLAAPYGKNEIWARLPIEMQQQIIDKGLKFYVIDAVKIAEELGLGSRINTIMQTAFFLISGVLPEARALELIKQSIVDTYGNKGPEIVEMNMKAVEATRSRIERVDYPKATRGELRRMPAVAHDSPPFVREVIAEMIAGRGEKLATSRLPDDGTYPSGTTAYEKRNIAESIPEWLPEVCIQCGECSIQCPHGIIRFKAYDPALLAGAPKAFQSIDAKGKEMAGLKFTLQVSVEDCTGCETCVQVCPAFEKVNGEKTGRKAINMVPMLPVREREIEKYAFFQTLPFTDEKYFKRGTIKGSQFLPTLFEFSGACAGCGETPVIKLATQLFGDRMIIGNATGCTSIYGANMPTTPYTKRPDGRGPAWSNSLFEDAAEFAMGMRLQADKLAEYARELLAELAAGGTVEQSLAGQILQADQSTQEGIEAQRGRVARLRGILGKAGGEKVKELASVADNLVKRSIWGFGGDGWAYDIGYGGLDHVIASGKDVNLLVLDTGVYSNTGGQMSKATPIGAIAKFAAAGKPLARKDLGLLAMSYGRVYVATIALSANRMQAIRAITEAEAYPGPSLIVAYSHCIAHGYDLKNGPEQQKKAVDSGAWFLFRYNPLLKEQGQNPFILDSKEPTLDIGEYMYREIRFRALRQQDPERAQQLLELARRDAREKYGYLRYLADRPAGGPRAEAAPSA